MQTYKRVPISFERGEGSWLWDQAGNKYLDALGGIAVSVLGHSHPAVTRAAAEQASKLIHTSNIYEIPAQQALADKLTELSGMDSVFFCNSGAEANEAAFKLARAYGEGRGVAAPEILVTERAFHGRTLAAISASGGAKVQTGFGPLMNGFVRVPFDDVAAAADLMARRSNIVAILVEPIQGEGGIVVPSDDYLDRLRGLCDQHDALLMLDEVQTGQGRTGKWFGFQHGSSSPDVITLAKGLANGIPIGACLAKGKAAEVLHPGMHGSTFGGNPFACTVAKAVIDVIDAEDLVGNAARMGEYLQRLLREKLNEVTSVKAIRGRGMMLGIEMDRPCADLVSMALDRGLLINVTADCVVRLLPPLNMCQDEVEQVVAVLSDTIQAFHNR